MYLLCPLLSRLVSSQIWWLPLETTWDYGGSLTVTLGKSVCWTMWVNLCGGELVECVFWRMCVHVWWRVSGVCVLENVCSCVVEVCVVCYVCESSFPPSLMHVHEQNKNSEFCAPLTSFDWNETDPNILGASSIDTTCTIWGLEVGT